MKLKIGLLVLTGIGLASTHAQTIAPPAVQWQVTLGGEGIDQLQDVRQTPDGGYYIAGFSDSPTNAAKTSSGFGAVDYWLVRVNASGQYQWDRSYGGTNQEFLRAIELSPEGGVVLAGHSNSDVSGNKTNALIGSGNLELGDFWVVAVDSNGGKVWERSYGGTNDEVLFAIRRVAAGGYILGGYSVSEPGGIKTAPHHGMNDFWVVRIDANGESVWDRSFGGEDADILYSLQETSDGGFILGGLSRSGISGNKTNATYGGDDVWVIKLDADGEKVWERVFGGTGNDGLYSIQQLVGGGYILGGYSASPESGSKTSANHGVADFWLVRLDANGNSLWDRSFGGMQDDQMYSVRQTPDGGFLLGGYSYSRATGNKTNDNFSLNDPPSGDFWVIRTDASGERLWEQVYGGTGLDAVRTIRPTSDGGWLLGGDSRSPESGNKTTPALGQQDFWAVKLGPDALSFPPQLSTVPQSANQISALGFRLLLHGVQDVEYVIEASTDLEGWTPVLTNTAAGAPVELAAPNAPSGHQLYRARLAQ